MKLSQTAGHAIAAALYVANAPSECLHSNGDICKQVGLPRPFMLKLLGLLTEKHILTSTRGRYGGYKLARSASEISLLEIIEAVDGTLPTPTSLDVGGLTVESTQLILTAFAAASEDAKARLAKVKLADFKNMRNSAGK